MNYSIQNVMQVYSSVYLRWVKHVGHVSCLHKYNKSSTEISTLKDNISFIVIIYF